MTKQLEALITSEIADFFAGFVEIHTELGGPNTVEEAQQQLTERVTRIASECEAALIAALEQSQQQNKELIDERTASTLEMSRIIQREINLRRNAEKKIAELEASNAQVIQAREHYKSLVSASKLAVVLPELHQRSCSDDDVWYAPDDILEMLASAGIAVQGDE